MSIDGVNCLPPFLRAADFTDGGCKSLEPRYSTNNKPLTLQISVVEGRLCQTLPRTNLTCCLPCPMTEWAYPDSFETMSAAANWVSVASTICCVALLLSWAVLPVDKTFRHYLSISLTVAVVFMNVGCRILMRPVGTWEDC